MRGETPDHTPVDADSDRDGNVSMEEAFIYARDHDTADEDPQYDSTPTELGAEVSLCGLIPTECVEDDSGALDIAGKKGRYPGQVSMPVRVQNAPNEVAALGFEVHYNPSVLSYTDHTPGSLVEGFDMFNVSNPEPGRIKVAGIEAGDAKIVQGASGYLVYLNFDVIIQECETAYALDLAELKNDIAEWLYSHGCFDCSACSCDIDQDGEITPQDALCAFQKYLEICPTSCGPCEEICCDVDQDSECTPGDALEIFKEYLEIRPNACSPEPVL